MSSWKTCCPSYARKFNLSPTPVIIGCRVNSNETNLIRGGLSDQERMNRPLLSDCGCKRDAPNAYATGVSYRDSSFLTMRYAMKAASYYSDRGQQQTQCCVIPSTTPIGVSSNSSINNYTSDNMIMAKAGCKICGSN